MTGYDDIDEIIFQIGYVGEQIFGNDEGQNIVPRSARNELQRGRRVMNDEVADRHVVGLTELFGGEFTGNYIVREEAIIRTV